MAKANTGFNKKHELSDELEAVVGRGPMSRPDVTKKLWVYIKKHDLQDAKKKRIICPDDLLGEVIGHKPIDMLKMTSKVSAHILKD